jgi:hypothetical protein
LAGGQIFHSFISVTEFNPFLGLVKNNLAGLLIGRIFDVHSIMFAFVHARFIIANFIHNPKLQEIFSKKI